MGLLDHACIGDIEGCRTILNTGFDINYVFDFEDVEYTALYTAVGNGYIECVRFLLEQGADPNIRIDLQNSEPTALFTAIHSKNKDMVELLLNYHADASLGYCHRPALHMADNDKDIIELLLKFKVDPNKQNDLGQTALHLACKASSVECVRLLLSYEADSSIKDHQDRVPRDLATNQEIIDLLDNEIFVKEPEEN